MHQPRSKLITALIGVVALLSSIVYVCTTAPQAPYQAATLEREFLQLFPNAAKNKMYTTGQYGAPTIELRAPLYDRYLLTLQAPARIPDSKSGPIVAVIQIVEITAIQPLPDGRTSISYGQSWSITGEQWKTLVKNGGNFGAIGVELKSTNPLPGFQSQWRGL